MKVAYVPFISRVLQFSKHWRNLIMLGDLALFGILFYFTRFMFCAYMFIFFLAWTLYPIIYACLTYIYELDITNGTLTIKYTVFDKKKSKKIDATHIKTIKHKGWRTYLGGSFKIVYRHDKIFKIIIRQYEVGEWTKKKNFDKLCAIISPFR